MLFRNILSLIAVLTAAGVPAGCSTTARLTRRQATAHLAQLSRTERQSKVRDDRPQVVRVERDSSNYYLVPVERDGQGEALGTVPIEEVVVVARVRSIPERRGRVTLDFNVELPKELLGRSRSVVITPFLHRQDEQIPLDDIIIRGALFDRVQQRDYWQYTTYLGRFRPDSVRAERAFQRFVKYPYAQDARLDSLIENRTSISYYYSQEVPTEETSRKMLITLRGRVEGLDDSAYTLPPSDTLTYTVSSLLSFLDTLPRYRIRVIDKYVTVNDRYSLSFRTGDARLVDTLGDNARELARIAALMERIVTQREFHVDSIVLTASASPEGRRTLNERPFAGACRGAAQLPRGMLRPACGPPAYDTQRGRVVAGADGPASPVTTASRTATRFSASSAASEIPTGARRRFAAATRPNMPASVRSTIPRCGP